MDNRADYPVASPRPSGTDQPARRRRGDTLGIGGRHDLWRGAILRRSDPLAV